MVIAAAPPSRATRTIVSTTGIGDPRSDETAAAGEASTTEGAAADTDPLVAGLLRGAVECVRDGVRRGAVLCCVGGDFGGVELA